MTAYLFQRLVRALIVLVGVTFVVFMLIHLGGDPINVLLPLTATQAQREALTEELNLDEPISIQYITFLKRALREGFGNSLRHREPALPLVIERLPATLKLMAAGVIVALLISVPTGILSAVYKDTWIDLFSRAGAIIGQSMPNFWFAIILILIFSVQLRLFPVSGTGTWQHLVLPGIAEGSFAAPIISRLLRSSLLEVLSQDYITAARAKGLKQRVVLFKHALKNALLPVITIVGLQIGVLFGGAVIVEMVFAYPGMGRLAVQAVVNRDIPLIQAFVAVTAFFIVITNILTDILYTKIDPRIQLGRRSATYG